MNKIKLFFGLIALVVAVGFTSCGETANNIKEKANEAAAATTDAAAGAAKTVGNVAGDVATGAAAVAGAAATAGSDAAKATGDAAGKVVDGAKKMAGDAAEAVAGKGAEFTSAYVCPMHCKGSGSDKAGKCPACDMDYVANTDAHAGHNH